MWVVKQLLLMTVTRVPAVSQLHWGKLWWCGSSLSPSPFLSKFSLPLYLKKSKWRGEAPVTSKTTTVIMKYCDLLSLFALRKQLD